MLAHLLDETFAGARWFAAFGVLLIAAGVTVLVWMVRRWLAHRRAPRIVSAESLVEAHPWLVPEERRRPGPRVQPVVCPDLPTQVLPRVDDDATQVLPHAALNAPTQVLYIVLPVDERERAQ